MCALNCPAWKLQNSLVVEREVGDDEYTLMVRGLVHLGGCFHPVTNEYRGPPHRKLVDRHVRNWMQSRSDFPEEEEKALSCMVAFVNRFDGSMVHRYVRMVPEERRIALAPPQRRRGGIGVWSREEVAAEIDRQGMTDTIRSQVDAAMALSDVREFLEQEKEKGKGANHSEKKGTHDSGKENLVNSGKRENLLKKRVENHEKGKIESRFRVKFVHLFCP